MKKAIVLTSFLALAVLWLFASHSADAVPANTDIPGGSITTDTTWDLAGSPYNVLGAITIINGATLTIEPGVEVRFNNPVHYLHVNNGTLDADGTAANPIVFTSSTTTPGSWRGIWVNAFGSVQLDHCEVAYAGGNSGFGAIVVDVSAASITNCEIHRSATEGIQLRNFDIAPTIHNTHLHNNAGYPITQNTVNMAPSYQNLTVNDNGEDAILAGSGNLYQDGYTFVDAGNDIPYHFSGPVAIEGGITATIAPGVEMFWDDPTHYLWANNGTLIANGTAANPIVFASLTATPGSWRGIWVDAFGSLQLDHCEVGYAGGNSGFGAIVVDVSEASITNCEVHHSATEGIQLRNIDIAPTIHSTHLHHNAGYAITQNTVNMAASYQNLTVNDNGDDAILASWGNFYQDGYTFVDAGNDIPYRFNGNVAIEGNATMQVAPGVEMLWDNPVHFLRANNGALIANGTQAAPIVFGTLGGNPGDWAGILVDAGGSAEFSYCVIRDGGGGANYGLTISNAPVSVEYCDIRNHADHGIQVTNAQPTIKENSIRDNGFGVRNTTPATVVDASFNFWGHPSGPFHPVTNPGGQGNAVSDGVIFNPWYSSDQLTPVDLEVFAVDAPRTAAIGEDITVEYSVRNNGEIALTRDWIDSLYLSTDRAFSIDDVLLTRHLRTGSVPAGGTYNEQVTAPLAGRVPGDYHVLVIADSRKTVPDPDRTNNELAADTPTDISINTLQLNVVANGTLRAGRDVYYRIDLDAGQDVLFSAELGGEYRGELYLRYGQLPTRSEFDFAASSFQEANQRILLTNAPGGDWYVLLHGNANAGSGVPFSLLAVDSPFLLFDVSPDNGGDLGQVTMNVQGVGFDNNTTVTLRNGPTTINPTTVELVDRYTLLAVFNLAGRARATYDVTAAKNSESETIVDGFEIVEGTPGTLEASLVLPGAARPNRPFRAAVEYQNVGDTDLAIPMLRVEAPAGASIYPENYEQDDATTSLQFIAMPDEYVSGGVIAPGQGGRYEFWAAIGPAGSTTYTLTQRTTADTDAFSRSELRAQIRPASPPDLWGAAWSRVVADIGDDTYGSFVTALTAAADEAHGYGIELRSVRELLGYMIQRAYQTLPADVRGTVLINQGGTLIPAAERFIALANSSPNDGVPTSFGVTTWHDGSFAIRDVTNGVYDVEVAGLHNPSIKQLAYDGSIEELTIIVQPAGALYGAVRGTAGWFDNVESAVIEVNDSAGNVVATGQTDEWGRYELGELPIGVALTVRAFSGAHLPSAAETLILAAGEERLLDVEVTAGGTIEGVVTGTNGQPVANAIVTAERDDGGHVRTTTTNGIGRYTLAGLYDATYDVSADSPADAPGYAPGVGVIGGQTQIRNITLSASGAVQLTVRDADTNQPLANVQIRAIVAGLTDTVRTDAGGQATFDGLPLGSVELSFSAENYLYTTRNVNVSSNTTNSYTVQMQQAGTVSGRLSRANGAPISGVPVALVADGVFGAEARTDADGNYRFANVPAGQFSVRFGGAGMAGNLVRPVTVGTASPSTTVDLVLPAANVAGAVYRADGTTPVADAPVYLVQNGEPIASGMTGADGRYSFLVLSAGTYELVVSANGIGMQRLSNVAVTLGADQPNRDMVLGGSPFVLTALRNGTPVDSGTVAVRLQGHSELMTYVAGFETDGSITIPHLQNGSYQISIETAAGASQRFVHTQSGPGNVSRTLQAGQAVSGIVTKSGQPAPTALITFIHQASGVTRQALAADDGSYTVEGLRSGNHTVWVSSRINTFEPRRLTGVAVSGGSTTVNVTVNSADTTLQGIVRNPSSDGVGLALVQLLDGDGFALVSTVSAQDGSYAINGAPSGNFTLRVRAFGHSLYTANVTIPASGSSTANVNLAAEIALRGESAAAGVRVAALSSSAPGQQAVATITGLTQPTQFPVHSGYADYIGSLPLTDEAKETSEVNSALSAFTKAKQKADLRFSTYETTYNHAQDIGSADALIVASQASLVTAKFTALMGLLTTDFQATAAESAYLTLTPLIADLAAGYQAGDFDEMGLALDSIDTLMTAGNIAGSVSDDFVARAGPAGLVISALRDLDAALDQVDTAVEAQVKARLQYEANGDAYRDAILELNAARNELGATVKAACGSGGGGGAPEPEEPEAPDEGDEEIVEQDETERRVSRDPNDIIGPRGQGPARAVANDIVFDYTILYENVPTATAPAQVVTIEHQVDADHDYSTFTFGDFGFGDLYFPVPAGRQNFSARLDLVSELGVYVEYSAEFNPVTGLAVWEFRSVDPETGDLSSDPDVGFLPPNGTPPEGEGFVYFTVRLKPDAADGTIVTAQAEIIFDDNEAIITPTWSNRIGEFYQVFLPVIR